MGSLIVLWWAVCAIFGTLFAPYDYLAPSPDILQSPSERTLVRDGSARPRRPVRVIVGARSIIVVALLATILGTVLGTAFGLVMGYFRGFVDETLSGSSTRSWRSRSSSWRSSSSRRSAPRAGP